MSYNTYRAYSTYNIASTDFQERENKSEYGYVYCVSNSSMLGILNIGITWMEPELKIKNINELPGLWYPPNIYKCEFAKKVRNVEDKRDTIYKLLSKYRINPIRKFFRVSLEDTRALFDLMDGDYWENGEADEVDEVDEVDEAECSNWNIQFDKRKANIDKMERRMLDCLFQKSDDLSANLNIVEANLLERKKELKEINKVIEERKRELASITNESNESYYITEY